MREGVSSQAARRFGSWVDTVKMNKRTPAKPSHRVKRGRLMALCWSSRPFLKAGRGRREATTRNRPASAELADEPARSGVLPAENARRIHGRERQPFRGPP